MDALVSGVELTGIIMSPPAWLLLPFLVLLGAIALAPVLSARLWERVYVPFSLGLAAISVGYYWFGLGARGRLLGVGHEYLSFVIFLGALFVITGGIHIEVRARATPMQNTILLLIGGVLANILGTTGASMLLIRPWLRMNKERIAGYHVGFFIFVVSNIGGSLTSVADPPLLLGHLEGVPFWWITVNAWPIWLVAMSYLLVVFYSIDCASYLRAVAARSDASRGSDGSERWRVSGSVDLVYALLAVAAMFIRGHSLVREVVMLGLEAVSWLTTPRSVRTANQFRLKPMSEVAVLFLGIFGTMLPALTNSGNVSIGASAVIVCPPGRRSLVQ